MLVQSEYIGVELVARDKTGKMSGEPLVEVDPRRCSLLILGVRSISASEVKLCT